MRDKVVKQKEKEEYAVIVAWGSGLEKSDTEEVDDTAFMATGDSNLEDEEKYEVSIVELKEKLHLFSKRK